MTSIRKAKKRLKADMAENERYIAEYERKPVSVNDCWLLDALYKTGEIQEEMLNKLKSKK